MKNSNVSILALALGATLATAAQAENRKVLLVVTNVAALPDGTPSGIHFNELTHPYDAFVQAGFAVELASPKGGLAPVDPATLDPSDPINARFWGDAERRDELEHTAAISAVRAEDYAAVYLVGGVTAMWDFPGSAELAGVVGQIYERGDVVGAVCHGSAALANVRLGDGSLLVTGRKLTSFTDEEEIARHRESVVPFLLESRLVSLGASFSEADLFKYHVVSDDRLVTGQNPASAFGVAHEMIHVLRRL